MYSKEKVIELLYAIKDDVSDSKIDYCSTWHKNIQYSNGVINGFDRALRVIQSSIDIVELEW